MKEIFVNLKRFEVPRAQGGVCPMDDPKAWIEEVMTQSVELGIGCLDGLMVVYMLPEALILPAREALRAFPEERRRTIAIGCQSVFRQDIRPGGNFGAFTTNLPAASARNMGCGGTIIGHSEERRDKHEIIAAFAPGWNEDDALRPRVMAAVDSLLNQQVLRALEQELHVLFCVGETAEERGGGDFAEQQVRIRQVLRSQLSQGLAGIGEHLSGHNVVIGYEPIWAIGPGKTPPDRDYIAFVSALIKELTTELLGAPLPVVYGGGLKQENAAMIASIDTIDGGLVALTRFTGDIGFYPDEFKAIIDAYQ